MVQAPYPLLSLEAFLKLPETKPAHEYINGQSIPKPMPQGKHSALQGELVSAINRLLKSQRVARAFSELRCTFGDRSIVPGVAVLTWPRIPRDQRDQNGEIANAFHLAPDWTIEILSPDQNQTKVTKNILHCLKYGTQMGWLIDPAERTVLVYRPGQEIEVWENSDLSLPLPAFASQAAELGLSVKTLFSWLSE